MDWSGFVNAVPTVVQAVLLLIVAWIVAAIFRNIVKGILNRFCKTKLGNAPAEATHGSGETISMLGNLTFAIVFFLFLPGALEKLGMSSVTAPITSMATRFLDFLPNIIAACILIAFGFFLAKLAAQLLNTCLKKTPLDSLQAKCKITPKKGNEFSDIISKIAYTLILIVFIVGALQVLHIPAISDPATSMVTEIFNFIPLLFGAIILIAFGVFLANLVGSLVQSILAGTGIDKFSQDTYQNGNPKAVPASKIAGDIVNVVIDLIFLVAGIKILKIDVLTNVGNAIIGYLPSVLAACLVLLAAWAAACWIEKSILKTYPNASGLALCAKTGIMILAGFMAISQLGISKSIIDTLFMWLCIAAAAAFAISFGIGGRDWAKKKLDDLSENTKDQLSDKK